MLSDTPRYAIVRPLGRGGMGAVHEAIDRETGERVAVKTLLRRDAHSLLRFKREFRLLANIQHPNLVRLYEFEADDDGWRLVMELVDGVPFFDYVGARVATAGDEAAPTAAVACNAATTTSIARTAPTVPASPSGTATPSGAPTSRPSRRVLRTPADPDRLRAAARQLAAGIHALHEHGRIHCDIKPSNILVTHAGRVVLLDFGIILEALHDDEDAGGGIAGTPRYMAPEVLAGERPTPASDWYSFGVVLYEALTGLHPFPDRPATLAIAPEPSRPVPPDQRRPDLPPAARDLASLAVALLDPDPRARPAADEIFALLGAESAGATTQPSQADRRVAVRSDELARLEQRVPATGAARGASVFVTGPSGIGKTTVLDQFCERAARAGAVVLRGRCYERETIPHKALDGLVDALCANVRKRADLSDAIRDALDVMSPVFPIARIPLGEMRWQPSPSPYDPIERRRRAFAGLRTAIEALADAQPVVAVIDDLQWGDLDSVEFVAQWLRSPMRGVLFVGAARSDAVDSSPFLRAVREEVGDRAFAATRLDIGPLKDDDVRAIVGAHAPDAPAALVDHIVAEAKGNPLFATELATYYAALPDDHSLETGLTVDSLLAHRIAALSDAHRALLSTVALASVPLRVDVARDAARLGAQHGRIVLDLVDARLVRCTGARADDKIEPYHDRVRDAAARGLDDDQRREVHMRIAKALAVSDDVDPEALAIHFSAAGRADLALQHALAAAERAYEQLAFDRAAALYRFALQLDVLPAAERGPVHYALANALASAGRGISAAAEYAAAAEHADANTRIDCHGRAAEQALMSGHFDEGLAMVDRVLAEVGESLPASSIRSVLRLLWLRGRLRVRGFRFRARRAYEVPPLHFTKIDVFARMAHGLAFIDPVHGEIFHTRRMLAALRTGEPHRIAQGMCDEAITLACWGSGPRARAARHVATARQLAVEFDDASVPAWAQLADGLIRYFAGDVNEAIRLLEAAEDAFLRLPFAHWGLINARVFRMFCLRFGGRFAEVRDAAREWIQDARRRGDLYAETTLRRTSVWGWLAADQPDRARHHLAKARWNAPSDEFQLQHYYQLEAECVIACYERASDRVPELLARLDRLDASLLRYVQIVRIVSRWLRARLLLLTGDERHHGAIRRLARKLRREQVAYGDLAGALVLGALAHRAGDDARAADIFAEAAARAAGCGLETFGLAARGRLAELRGTAPPDPDPHGVVDLARTVAAIAPW